MNRNPRKPARTGNTDPMTHPSTVTAGLGGATVDAIDFYCYTGPVPFIVGGTATAALRVDGWAAIIRFDIRCDRRDSSNPGTFLDGTCALAPSPWSQTLDAIRSLAAVCTKRTLHQRA